MGWFETLAAWKTRLGLRMTQVLAIGVGAAAITHTLVSAAVWKAAGAKVAGAYFVVGVAAAAWKLSQWPGYSTPALPSLTRAAGSGGATVRVVALTDTHNRLTPAAAKALPDADVFVHCGDFTVDGSVAEVRRFNEWLGHVPMAHRVVIAGNHDLVCDPASYDANRSLLFGKCKKRHSAHGTDEVVGSDEEETGLLRGAAKDKRLTHDEVRRLLSNATVYLVNESAAIAVDTDAAAATDGAKPQGRRTLRVHGSPTTVQIPGSPMNAFGTPDTSQGPVWAKVPPNTDLLLTHGPPFDVLDLTFFGRKVGSHSLAARLAELGEAAPAVHVFGHIHEGRGVRLGAVLKAAGGAARRVPTTFINACSVNMFYRLRSGDARHGTGAGILFDVPLRSP